MDDKPTEYHIQQVARYIRQGKTVLTACFRAGVLYPKALRWLEAGRQGTCPACVRLVKAIRQAGRAHDEEHLRKITKRHPEE